MGIYRVGVRESLIKVHGDWISDTYTRYLEFPTKVRALVPQKMADSF